MPRISRNIVIAAAALATGAGAGAQAPAAPSPATAADAAYPSAFDGYRPFSAGEVGDWRRANDTVREVGGWRAYAREIHGGGTSQGTVPAPSRPAPAAAPARPASPHQEHHR
ncbi:hypothetical protein [Ramlibacter pallidus]|uniref:Formate dehydrogenase n=1 Tax=Ramlibacter pallidus TaxID=2780087 RepID=A0ABR9RYB1_9BURK|nr:hypothetical protein [Ramlibacter pallidus]MBE7366052.1 hypothetical protein [Ramlibacter pallidus]